MTKLVNRAKMTTATTGTGTITLGSASSGYQSFADAGVVNGDVVRYVIEDGVNWEIGTGTYTASGTTLSRTVSESSNSDTAITLSGTAVVYITAVVADILQPDNNLSDLANASTARSNLGLAIGTNVQAYDAGLQSISGLTTAADRMIYTTAADTYAVTTLTAAGRAILDDADAAAQRTTLGLNIGTNVQAYDAGLQSISGLTTAADRMIYTTAADTYAVTTLTAAGRAILDDADAAAQRTTLGLAIGTNVQAYDADLAAIAGLAVTDGNFIVGNGTTWVAESGATARTSLGLGSLATLSTISDSNWSGTDLSVANGGTGASSFTANNVLLGNGTSAFQVVAPGTSGNVLTSNGTTWTSAAAPSSNSYTLLGTMATTSGASVSLTGLDLSSYVRLYVDLRGVSGTSSGAYIRLNGQTTLPITSQIGSASNTFVGFVYIDLTSGNFVARTGVIASINSLSPSVTDWDVVGRCATTTASTSISFSNINGNFDAGSIAVYGVK